MSDYRISAVIPTYNNAAHIARAIESALRQSYKPFEIIVVDDGSADNTREVVAAYGEKVRYIYRHNAGPSAARNAGILAASGDWIAFLDSDDEWLENRLGDQICLLERNPGLCWLSSNFITCLCVSERRAPYTPPQKFRRLLDGGDTMSYYDAMIKGISGCMDTMFIKRSLLIDAGLFSCEYTLAEDLDLWWRIACRCPEIGLVPTPSAIYHTQVHGSITKSSYPAQMYAGLIRRNSEIAAGFGTSADFNRMAAFVLMRWIRSMLFYSDREEDVIHLLNETGRILPLWFKIIVRLAIIRPDFTQFVLMSVSRTVRRFGFRKRLVPPPDKMSKG